MLLVLRDELVLELHYRILDAGSRKVLDSSLGCGWRSVVEAPLSRGSPLVVHAEGDGAVALTGPVARLLSVGALADEADSALVLRLGRYQATLPEVLARHCSTSVVVVVVY